MDLCVDDGVVTILGGLSEELMDFWESSVGVLATPVVHALGERTTMLLRERLVVTSTEVLELTCVGVGHGGLDGSHTHVGVVLCIQSVVRRKKW